MHTPTERQVQDPTSKLAVVEYSPMILDIIEDFRKGIHTSDISRKFHNTLVEIVLAGARGTSLSSTGLSGGCFQNKFLAERIVNRLDAEGFRPCQHRRVPPNDGGIALGQLYATNWKHQKPRSFSP